MLIALQEGSAQHLWNSKAQSVCALELHSDYTQPVLNSKYAFICEMCLTMWVEHMYVTTCEYRLNKLFLYLLCKCSGVQTLDIHYKYKKGPHSSFFIRYSPKVSLSSATWHHNPLPYLLGLPSILRMEAEKAWNKAWSYNSTFVWNVRKKKKTCLENIFSFGLVSSLMPRLPCPCGKHLVVWFEFLNCHIAMSGKCIIIVPRMQFPLLAAWLLCNPTFKQSATFPNHQHISRLWKNWQTFSFQSPTLR